MNNKLIILVTNKKLKDKLPVLLLAVFGGFSVFFPLVDTDIWWHLAAAREMIREGRFLFKDPFSFTYPNAEWINLHWIFQLITFLIFNKLGVLGIIFFKSLLFSITIFILYQSLAQTQRHTSFSLILFSAIIHISRYLLDIRPVFFTIFYISIFLWCLERYRIRSSARYFLFLAIIQVFWVNTQGLFMLGIAIVTLYVVGEWLNTAISITWPGTIELESYVCKRDLVKLTAFIFVLAAISLVNPYGIKGVRLPLELLRRIEPSGENIFSSNISENIPLLSMIFTEPHYVAAVAIVTVIGILLFITNARRLYFAHVFLFLCFCGLAWMAERNIILFFSVAMPIISHYTAFLWQHKCLQRWQCLLVNRMALIVSFVIVFGFAALNVKTLLAHAPSTWIAPFSVPHAAVEYLQKNPIKGNMFNSDRFGGYISWSMYPPVKTFIDDRLVIRPKQFFAEYLHVLDSPQVFNSLANSWNITHVILQTAVFDRYMNLARWLYDNPAWQLVYADGVAAIFAITNDKLVNSIKLDSDQFVQSVLTNLALKWKREPKLYNETALYFGLFLMNMGFYNTAMDVFKKIPSVEARYYLAYCVNKIFEFGSKSHR